MASTTNAWKRYKLNKLFFLLILQILLPAGVARADTGPKPTMDFEFKQEMAGNPVKILSGILYECNQSDCSDAAALKQLGPQGFDCTEDHCNALAYGFAPYHRLNIVFSDGKTRQSNIFETAGFNSNYTVTVRPEDLLVETQFGSAPPLWGVAVLVLCTCLLCGGVLLVAGIALAVWVTSRK